MESKGVSVSSSMAKTWKLSDIDVLSASEALDKLSATYICAPGLFLTSTLKRCNRNIIHPFNWQSFIEIGEMACSTTAWCSLGHTLNFSNLFVKDTPRNENVWNHFQKNILLIDLSILNNKNAVGTRHIFFTCINLLCTVMLPKNKYSDKFFFLVWTKSHRVCYGNCPNAFRLTWI